MKTALGVVLLLFSFLPLGLFASVAKDAITSNGLRDAALDMLSWDSAIILAPLVAVGVLLFLGGLTLAGGGHGESAGQ